MESRKRRWKLMGNLIDFLSEQTVETPKLTTAEIADVFLELLKNMNEDEINETNT